MKPLHTFTLKFFLIGVIAVFLLPLLARNYKAQVNGKEVYTAIKKSRQKQAETKTLLIGDSVANQLFDNETTNGAINSLACNQAVSMVGHYLLLKEYLNNNKDVDQVVLLYHPQSFANNLDQEFTFHYFLKPFNKRKFKAEFTTLVKEQIRKIPYFFVSQFPIILRSNFSPQYKGKMRNWKDIFSPVSKEYLHKMKTLTDARDIKFTVIAPPVRASMRDSISLIDREILKKKGLLPILNDYLNNIEYSAEKHFVDDIHFKVPDDFRAYVQL